MAMWAVRLLAQPPIQHWPYLARAAGHTGLWMAFMLLLQYGLLGVITLLSRSHLQRSARPVKLHWARMLAASTLGICSFAWPLGLLAAWLNPGAPAAFSWDFSCPNMLALGYWASATLTVYDAYSYAVHRWLHANKTAFRLIHAKHHEHRAALDVTSASYQGFWDGTVSVGLPVLAMYGAGQACGNWWWAFAAIYNSVYLVDIGHCGHNMSLGDLRDVMVLLLNPFALWYEHSPVRATPMVHQVHHDSPTHNFAFFYTYLDEIFNTSRDPQPPCSLLVLGAHAVWAVVYFGSIHLLLSRFQASAAAYLLAYVLCSPMRAAAVAQRLRLPEATRRLFGWLMDAYRADSCITYVEPGTPGAFEPAAPAAADGCVVVAAVGPPRAKGPAVPAPWELGAPEPGAAAAASGWQEDKTPAPLFVFACHPTGVISRAAFCTFGARGWASPVSRLAAVRLAIGSQLMRLPLPLVREFLLACGCIPADADTLRAALRAGCSVAITPGGWREVAHVGTYNLVLQRRTGFVALAREEGARLVPVLCLGEQELTGPREPGRGIIKWLQSQRPHPVRVVFGEPLVAREGESVEKLHSRYVKALLQLGQQHGIQLSIVE